MDDKTNKLSDARKTLTEAELREAALLLEIVHHRRDLCRNSGGRGTGGADCEDPASRALYGLESYAFDRLVEIEAKLWGS